MHQLKIVLLATFFFASLSCFAQKRTVFEFPSITFKPGHFTLSDSAKNKLNQAAATLQKHPKVSIVVIGYSKPTKQAQQLSWDRVNAIVQYLAAQNISLDRMIYRSGQQGYEEDTVDIVDTMNL